MKHSIGKETTLLSFVLRGNIYLERVAGRRSGSRVKGAGILKKERVKGAGN